MGKLEGKVALITGAASGIGAACAVLLAKEGAAIALTDIQDAKGAEITAQITSQGGHARYFHHDVTREEAWVSVMADVAAAFGRLDILVNNAGIGIGAPSITAMSLVDFQRQQAINVDGVFLGVKHGLLAMRAAGQGGSIINMSSVAGLKGSPTLAAYSATKGAVRLFTKAVALECAAAKDGVRVNSVHPGIIETPIWLGIAGAPDVAPDRPNAAPDLDALSAVAVPLGVKGQPEDIAQGVLWLASDEARYVTGAELVIDGGISIR
jgi:NAD(P)-dependent dehydrogenase (short-subunit alcohol dehydrogenase family)